MIRSFFNNLSYKNQLIYVQERFNLSAAQSEILLKDSETRRVIDSGYNFEVSEIPIPDLITSKGIQGIESIVLELADELVPNLVSFQPPQTP
ncbi:Uncharacterised protein [uncultured archaeon]|nr:Uncharacterised protein [uncultured archaeon]